LKGHAVYVTLDTIPEEFSLCLNGNIHELERLTAGVARFCAVNSLGADTAFQLNLVLEELFVNAVRHGGCEGLENAACFSLTCQAKAILLLFRDRGGPFDLTAAPDADLQQPLAERQSGGLGIHLVRQIMRDVSYRREGEWNVLTMQHPVPEQQEIS
jgi:anti-sigma regulatory factor (Ser/Thr protein kinase)